MGIVTTYDEHGGVLAVFHLPTFDDALDFVRSYELEQGNMRDAEIHRVSITRKGHDDDK